MKHKLLVLAGLSAALGLWVGTAITPTVLGIHWELTGTNNNGWAENLSYGRDDLSALKAASNSVMAMGAHKADHAIYTLGLKDSDGNKLKGDAVYKISVNGPVPHEKAGFFSITSYDANYPLPLVKNELRKYSINNLNAIDVSDYSESGFSFYYSAVKPEGVKDADWLPASSDSPLPIFRIYHPEPLVVAGEYIMPTITRVETQ